MNAERLRRLAARLFRDQAYCCLCGETGIEYLIQHKGSRGNIFWVCASCLSDVVQEM